MIWSLRLSMEIQGIYKWKLVKERMKVMVVVKLYIFYENRNICKSNKMQNPS
jgi:hypothetical protein